MINKIWKDSVGSKVIAWLIIGVLTLIGLKIKSYYDEKSFSETFNWLINYQIKLIYVLLTLVIFLILRWLYKRLFTKKESLLSKSKKRLRAFNHITDTNQSIRYEWVVYFGSNGKPFITDLEFYCTEHRDAPLRFLGNNCSVNGCKNSRLNINEYRVQNHIESLVINEWNKTK